MIVNPDKFKSIILTKNKSDDIPTGFSIGTDIVSIEKSVKLLGIHLDNRLNFNLHINTICKSASNQLNALVRLKKFLSFEQKKVLVNSFILSNFDYCPLVWFISSTKSLKKVENSQKRVLRFSQNVYHSSYEILLHILTCVKNSLKCLKSSDETKQSQLHQDWTKIRIKEYFLIKNMEILLGFPVIL